jgi:hypothetical protein
LIRSTCFLLFEQPNAYEPIARPDSGKTSGERKDPEADSSKGIALKVKYEKRHQNYESRGNKVSGQYSS